MFIIFWIFTQIILESLPVSSSGHVQLLEKVYQLFADIPDFIGQVAGTIDFLLHGPMVMIVFIFFFHRWWQIIFNQTFSCQGIFTKSFWLSLLPVGLYLFIVDGITFLFWKYALYPNIFFGYGFLITGLLLYLQNFTQVTKDKVIWNITDAVYLGIVQGFSLMPGISRFASTFAAGRYLGYNGQLSFALSFGIQFPLIVAAFVKGSFATYYNLDVVEIFFDFKVLLAILSSSFISYLVLCWVDTLIKKETLWKFAFYMVLPSVLSFFL